MQIIYVHVVVSLVMNFNFQRFAPIMAQSGKWHSAGSIFHAKKNFFLRKHKCVYSFVNYCLQVANICNLFFYLVVEKEFHLFILMTITPGFYFEQKIQCFYSEAFVINSFFLHLIDLWPRPQIFDIIYSKIF